MKSLNNYKFIRADVSDESWKRFKEIARQNHRLSGGSYVAVLIERVVRSVYHGKQDSNVNSWRLNKLRQMGRLNGELEAYISSESSKSMDKIGHAVDKAVERANIRDMDLFREAADAGLVTKTLLSKAGTDGTLFQKYRDAILTNTRALQASGKAFRDTVNFAWVNVRTGTKSIDDAVQDACHRLGGTGLRVDYISDRGRHSTYSLDASVRRDVVTSLTQSTAEMTLAENEALGNDLVQVSTLADSRDSHIPFQGNVYSYNGKSNRYPSLVAECGFGTASGICGINCRHQLFPYFETLEGRHRNEEPKDTGDAEQRYADSQQQRAYERDIRSAKRQLAADEAGAPDKVEESRAALAGARSRMRGFIDETGRTRRYARERV